MRTIKYRIYLNRFFAGIVFITDNNPLLHGSIVGTLLPLTGGGAWDMNALDLAARRAVTEIYPNGTPDDFIINALIFQFNPNNVAPITYEPYN